MIPGSPARLHRFRTRLLAWYSANKRALPWRESRDPYRVWVSEIMLQQTRVAAVLDRYREFIARFPSCEALAGASEAEVLAAWSGLGYYRRARMMRVAAKQVMADYQGKFPRTSSELRMLPGIGRYTANAIASIAFSEPVPVVDGNVERVLERMSARALSSVEVWKSAEELLDPDNPGNFNQAMMELGATVCLPGIPACKSCPVKFACLSRGAPLANSRRRDARQKKAAALALNLDGGRLLLQQRSIAESLMPGMWELPAARTKSSKPLLVVKHSITITDWTISVVEGRAQKRGRWIPLSEVHKLPLTGLTRKILRRLGLFVLTASTRA